MNPGIDFFAARFGIGVSDLESLLGVALSRGGDYADLYFEYLIVNSVGLEEQIVKSATKSISQGVGVRVVVGEKTGFAYTDEITVESIKQAALTAAYIANDSARNGIHVKQQTNLHNLYPVEVPMTEIDLERKIALLRQSDNAARSVDKRIREVQSSLADEYKVIMIAASDGVLAGDIQPLTRFNVTCIADDDGNLQIGRSGGGGRVGIDFYNNNLTPEYFAKKAAIQAIMQFEAIDAPAGVMEVVLGPGWPGVMLHEA